MFIERLYRLKFINSIVRTALFVVILVFSKWVLGAPPQTRVAYSIYGFINALNIFLSVLSSTNSLILLRIPTSLLYVTLYLCSLCI